MRNTLRALAFVGLCIIYLQNPLAADLRPIWLPDVLAHLSDSREVIGLALGFVALCIMSVSLGAARAGLPLGDILRALAHR